MKITAGAYRLTIVATIGVLVLGTIVVLIVGGPVLAAPYLALLTATALPGLFGLLRSETNALQIKEVATQASQLQQATDSMQRVTAVQHAQNQQKISATDAKIDALAQALKKGPL